VSDMDEALGLAIGACVLSFIAAVLAWVADRKATHALEAQDDDPTMELPIFPTMGVGSRAPEDGWAERMRLNRPEGRNS
jgi:hypothetical protein